MRRQPFIAVVIVILIITQSIFPVKAAMTPSDRSFESLASAIDTFASEHIDANGPGAAVVIFHDDQVIFSKGYGLADIAAERPMTSDQTLMEYGSVSKLFVYASIMQLVEQGLLDLNTDIKQYLPDEFSRELQYDQPITLLNIMNHQAGFEDILTDIVVTHPKHTTEFSDLLLARQPAQVYETGTITAYSNYAVALAAYVVQEIIGQPFYTYVQDMFFDPLMMQHTTFDPELFSGGTPINESFSDRYTADHESADQTTRAKGYAYQPASGTFQETGWSYIPLYPVGAVRGTAEDLARFAMALAPPENDSGPLFQRRETLDLMLSQTSSMGPGLSGFAHGFIEYNGPYRGVGHGGNTAGFSAQVNFLPEQRIGVIVLANIASDIVLTEGITRLVLGHKMGISESDAADTVPDTTALAGSYLSARRPHHGFLKLYGFLGLLHVEALEGEQIRVRLGEQSALYHQVQPYLFTQTSANGSFIEYNFKAMYFDMVDDTVFRVSGDFMPLPNGYTKPWLIADASLAGISVSSFLLLPFVLLIAWIIKCKRRSKRRDNVSNGYVHADRSPQRLFYLILISGFTLSVNNLVLVLRMLADHYRSFSEVHVQLLLNFPLALIGIMAVPALVLHGKKRGSRRMRRAAGVMIILFIMLLYSLIKWDFLSLQYW